MKWDLTLFKEKRWDKKEWMNGPKVSLGDQKWNPKKRTDDPDELVFAGISGGYYYDENGYYLGTDDNGANGVYYISSAIKDKFNPLDLKGKNVDLILEQFIITLEKGYVNTLENINTPFKKLALDHLQFKKYAGWIDHETEPIGEDIAMGNHMEKQALGWAIKNWADKRYNNSIPDLLAARVKAGYAKPALDINNSDKNSVAAVSAAVYVLRGGVDVSNKATQWDGSDQAAMPPTIQHFEGYHTKQKEQGWTISKEHYNTWKNALTNTPWGRRELLRSNKKLGTRSTVPGLENEPQFLAPMYSETSDGKVGLESSACYGTTIFWRVK
jgi:hypothetical protein